MGIPADLLPHVFERFAQGDGATTRMFGGLGLGLSIVRHVVEAHGGEVRAHSDGEGRGARMVVELPMPEQDSLPSDGTTEATGAPVRLDDRRVLVLDDDADTCEFLGAALAAAGAIVRIAGATREAIEAMRDFAPHVIVADIAMPGEDGYAFIREVRRMGAAAGGSTPAMALSGLAHASDRARAVSAGFHVHVPKPIDPNALVFAVASLLDAPPAS